MSVKAFPKVLRAFPGEAKENFGFLVAEFGLAGPIQDDRVLPSVQYHGAGIAYDIALDTHEVVIQTSVWIERDGQRVSADLEELVEASGLAPRQRVTRSAQSLFSMRKSLADQASWVRQLHSRLTGPGGPDLIRTAAQPHSRR